VTELSFVWIPGLFIMGVVVIVAVVAVFMKGRRR
jgi:hypothetical protein